MHSTLLLIGGSYKSRLLDHPLLGAIVYLVTALIPSDTACLASSPGSNKRSTFCISLLVIVDFLLYEQSRVASVAILSNESLTNEFIMFMVRLEMPVSG